MQLTELLDGLGYSTSPNFLRPTSRNSFASAADFSHVFRRAQEPCNLRGVYSLRHTEHVGRDTIVPVVYVCEADDDSQADIIHQRVWNQNVVPFLVVVAPKAIRLYSGFRYDRQTPDADPELAGLLRAASEMKEALAFLEGFRSEQIDNGTIWEQWGGEVTPETRVDWRLLSSLNDLDAWLQKHGVEDPEVSHALIGKYVYLHYLRERDILSDKWLAEWGLEEGQIFGRHAQASAFWEVVEKLDERLNGCVFPLPSPGGSRPNGVHIQRVAGTFQGDDPVTRHLALDFGLYNFSFIPIETLSVIYEQFLHSQRPGHAAPPGRAQGAYYTPLPLVNFMLEELDSLQPFREGMRVLDPACGSGAFLVQCYRRIIEQDGEFEPGKFMRPARLRELLERQIFGIDRDRDACRVAELSLTLTLLDYVHPPDLSRTPNFRLPDLHGTNIHKGDFFDPKAQWRDRLHGMEFDWIVGNPPWIELKEAKVSPDDGDVWAWMQENNRPERYPVGGNQVAEAFAWKVTGHLKEGGHVALLLPAMTLFKDESRTFRQRFLSTMQVHAVANFANLAEVLFPGHRYRKGRRTDRKRPRRPAAAFFYATATQETERISVFSPLVAEQPANRPTSSRDRKDTWNIVIDANQIRTVDKRDVADGGALPWKAAMWGSHLDLRLLGSLASRYESFRTFCKRESLTVAEGFQLRERSGGEEHEELDAMPELAGKPMLNMAKLRHCGLIFRFPPEALDPIPPELANLRVRGGRAGLRASRPPHVILDESRRFAVYSDEFVAVPPRQIGISGHKPQSSLLKALSLYLVSDFATYHQFLTTPQWGISTSVSTLRSLRELPLPFSQMGESEVREWADLHRRILEAARSEQDAATPILHPTATAGASLPSLLGELNDRVFRTLHLRDHERALVRELVHLRMELIQGKVSDEAHRSPSPDEMRRYATLLTDELDAFVEDQGSVRHSTTVVHNGQSAIVRVKVHVSSPPRDRVRIEKADPATGEDFKSIRSRVRKEHSQWVYFERNLRLYEARNTYIFKPLERLHWTDSQAILDAGSIIAETLS
jgi:hypothetical protein